MLDAFGSLDTSLLATVVKNAIKVSATSSLSKVVEPSTSKPIEVEPDFILDEVLLGYESTDQKTRDAIPIPVQCWARVTDPGPTPAPANVTCSLGMHGKSNYGGND